MTKKKIDVNLLIGCIAVLVIILSLVNIGIKLTGKSVTDTAVVNVTIESAAVINFTDDFFDFGSGHVGLGNESAILESNGTSTTGGDWSWSADSLTLENLGNVNVTLDLKTVETAATFIGGSAVTVTPEYNYSVDDAADNTGACTAGVTLKAWNDVNTTSPGTRICGVFGYDPGLDEIDIDIRLVIPRDSITGGLTDTFTATATAIP